MVKCGVVEVFWRWLWLEVVMIEGLLREIRGHSPADSAVECRQLKRFNAFLKFTTFNFSVQPEILPFLNRRKPVIWSFCQILSRGNDVYWRFCHFLHSGFRLAGDFAKSWAVEMMFTGDFAISRTQEIVSPQILQNLEPWKWCLLEILPFPTLRISSLSRFCHQKSEIV